MDEGMVATASGSSLWWRVRDFPRRARGWLLELLLHAVVWLVGDSNLMRHARRELPPSDGDDMQALMNRDLLQIVAVFASHGHSGFSAGYAVSVLEKLLRFQPLRPLTGEPDEWIDHGDGTFQNNRCSHVFKQADRFDGKAYDIYGKVFREPGGACYTNGSSHVPVTFPYVPKTEYVDVPASEG